MTTGLREQLESLLGTAYLIERELGGGGMSRVFVAQETALGRRVVVKVLPPDLSSAVNGERFRREIQLAASLQHPHIVPLLSAGESGGLLYYTMPFVEGESLRARLGRQRKFPIADAVRVLRDVAAPLAYAHARGVIHRDLKPDNVLLSGEYPMIVDFGIAKAIAAAVHDAGESLTQLGSAIGTPAYMAPEQVMGDPSIDHRADIYAFGTMAYEILCGAAPFAGRSLQATASAHVLERPERLDWRRADVPPALADLVMRCLSKEPSDRPQSFEEVIATLDAMTTGPRTAVGAADPDSKGAGRATEAQLTPDRPGVAVLPFTNLSPDPADEYFADGITEEVICAIGRLHSVRVAARASSFAFKGKQVDPREVAERLGVDSLLLGSVRKSGARLRISAELVNPRDGFQLWAERFDRELTDVFAVQDEIAGAIAAALRGKLITPRAGVAPRGAVDPVAYELYLKGQHHLRQYGEGLRRSIGYFERALEVDPEFAQAWAGIAAAHVLLGIYSVQPVGLLDKVVAAARKALALNEHLADAHSVLGYALWLVGWDWERGREHQERALALEPDSPVVLGRYAMYLASGLRFDDAVEHIQRAVRVDPLSDWTAFAHAAVLVFAHRFEDAAAVASEALELNPHYAQTWRLLGDAQVGLGQHDAAVKSLERAAALMARNQMILRELIMARAALGDREEAERLLAELLDRRGREWIAPNVIAGGYVCLGRYDEGFEWLERALRARDFWLAFGGVDPVWDPVRGDPRFERILDAVGVPGRLRAEDVSV